MQQELQDFAVIVGIGFVLFLLLLKLRSIVITLGLRQNTVERAVALPTQKQVAA